MSILVSILIGFLGLILIIIFGGFAFYIIVFLSFAIKGIIDETPIYKIVYKQTDYFIKKRIYIFFWKYVKGGDSFKHNFPIKFHSLGDASEYVRKLSKGYRPKFMSSKYRISERENHKKRSPYVIERRILFGLLWQTVNHNDIKKFKNVQEAESFIRIELIGDRMEVVKTFSKIDFN